MSTVYASKNVLKLCYYSIMEGAPGEGRPGLRRRRAVVPGTPSLLEAQQPIDASVRGSLSLAPAALVGGLEAHCLSTRNERC